MTYFTSIHVVCSWSEISDPRYRRLKLKGLGHQISAGIQTPVLLLYGILRNVDMPVSFFTRLQHAIDQIFVFLEIRCLIEYVYFLVRMRSNC